MGMSHVINAKAGSIRLVIFSLFTPRIWKIMILAAYPFFLLTTRYFEALERMGPIGAFIADTFMPATIIGYVVLIFVLKKRAV